MRDLETDETRGREKKKIKEETETFPGAQLQLTDGRRRWVWRERKGGVEGRREISKD